MDPCSHEGCEKAADYPYPECYRHRIMGVGFRLQAPAVQGDWHRTAREYREENFGTSDERELGRRGIERAT